ncbi:hypothetical protein NKR19_g5517 [Coniochaeta hoffmannii]|uniref:Uncharacterized protein n=1 Tax=Coniochaeta hoffmannii TaxID=91930 RepID=A0AA38RJA4_9PEZI|nr:hypothetical protein NKR19_g5517 [Coniochaeta hoffmannii]
MATTVGQGGLETGSSSTELYTEGLSTCIGAGVIGGEDGEKKIDKALAHVSSETTGPSFQTQFDDWKKAIQDSKMTDISLYLSVPAADIIPAACRAMGDMIAYAKQTCKDLGAGCATLERKNEDKDNAPPFGTVLIKEDRQVEMEGKVVSANVGIGRQTACSPIWFRFSVCGSDMYAIYGLTIRPEKDGV